jgi:hypothetical protein
MEAFNLVKVNEDNTQQRLSNVNTAPNARWLGPMVVA